jgi:hypothetical protein
MMEYKNSWPSRKLDMALAALTLALTILASATAGWAQSTETVLHAFTGGKGGVFPENLVADSHGNLYGVADGGTKGFGLVFKMTQTSPGNWKASALYNFTGGTDGSDPDGLVVDRTGKLFGVALTGGNLRCKEAEGVGCGTVFELAPASSVYQFTVLYTFQGLSDGAQPTSLIVDSAGHLFGTAAYGGNNSDDCGGQGCGTAFELATVGGVWQGHTLHSFDTTDGPNPASALALDAAGNLYGTSTYGGIGSCTNGLVSGCGLVYELVAGSGWYRKENVLYQFLGTDDGAGPGAGVILDSTGNIYGATSAGGDTANCVAGCGVVFKLQSGSGAWTESLLYAFSGATDGSNPRSGLTQDKAGNFYGTTQFVNGSPYGGVYELQSVDGSLSEGSLYSFADGSDGGYPIGNLILDLSGNIYGTTSLGGNHGPSCGTDGCGVVFEISPGAK